MFADDIVLAAQSTRFTSISINLMADLEVLGDFFLYCKPSPSSANCITASPTLNNKAITKLTDS